jgi:hypothetical protein
MVAVVPTGGRAVLLVRQGMQALLQAAAAAADITLFLNPVWDVFLTNTNPAAAAADMLRRRTTQALSRPVASLLLRWVREAQAVPPFQILRRLLLPGVQAAMEK